LFSSEAMENPRMGRPPQGRLKKLEQNSCKW
jgi:hypothetical protein